MVHYGNNASNDFRTAGPHAGNTRRSSGSRFCGIRIRMGIGIANEAAAGIMTEDPKKFGYALVLLALPGTQGIYGLLVAVLSLQKAGPRRGRRYPTVWQGLGICFACLPVAISGFYSAIWQGKSSAASILMISKRPEQIGKAVILRQCAKLMQSLGS